MSEEKMKHSPLPWKVTSFEYNSNPVSVWRQIVSEDNGYQIAADVEEADSNFIITACNSYYDNQEEIAGLKREIQMKEDAFEAWIEEHAEAKAAIAELVEALSAVTMFLDFNCVTEHSKPYPLDKAKAVLAKHRAHT